MTPNLAIAKSRRRAAAGSESFSVGSTDLFNIVRNSKAELSSSQRRVAILLLDNPKWFVRASVLEIAARLHISAPTVVRFARQLGCEGLRDLKLKLAGAMALHEPSRGRAITGSSPADDVVASLADHLTVVLNDWRRQIDRVALEKAGEIIHRARQIMCFGANAFSNLLAQRLHGGLFQLGYSAHSLSDANYQLAAATTLTKDDVLIVVSLLDQQPTLSSAIELAKMRGASTITLTGSGTGLAPKSDIVVLLDDSRNSSMHQDIDGFLLQTVTVETLIVLVGLKRVQEPASRQ
jgi:RpiR family transcriptional regulator, carbohydrate utilization regulator